MDDRNTVLLAAEALDRLRQGKPARAESQATVVLPATPQAAPAGDTETVILPAGAAHRPTPVAAPAPARPPQAAAPLAEIATAQAAAPASPVAALPVTPPARPEPAPIALQPGYRLHEYRIDAVLGQGGFGITYLATDVNLHAQVAIKEYLPAQFAMRARDSTVRPRRLDAMPTLLDGLDQFLVEARTLATFRHRNIVRVARFFEANRTAYMVLDYERGRALGDWWLNQRRNAPALSRLLGGRARDAAASGATPFSEPDLLLLLHPLLDGLALVHRSGVLHRDIKPDNLCVRDEDGSLVLLDFGAARPASGGAPDAPSILTPGYAPIEQYLGDNQGPWTDLYALGATLYWMVTGQRPREAPDRQAAPQADLSAEEAGAGRYSREFLRAIDWALQLRPEDRPQSVEAFRLALFAAHAASLGLQEALAAGAATQADSEGTARSGAGRRIVHPGSWPLALKMALALVIAAVLPMSITGYHNYTTSVEALARAERRSLEHLALTTSGRLSQLIEDSRRVTAFVASNAEVAEVLTTPTDAGKAALLTRFRNLVATNPDVHLLTLMDASGNAVVSTAPEVVGGNYAFRDYFRTAMAGRSNVTSIIVGAVAGRAGAYVAYPVKRADEKTIGVVVLRLRAETIGAIVDTARSDSREPFLVDGDGVLIHHRNNALRFRSLARLSPSALAAISADQRFRRDRIDSLDMPSLAAAMVGARREGNVDFDSTISGVREVAGFAPVSGHDWVVGVSESHDSFEAPLQRMFRQVLYSLLAVGTVFVLLALLFARSIVRPVKQLTRAADALKRGDYEGAHVKVSNNDEIGALARTFNVMIDVLRQRERERGMRAGGSISER
ncbi:hypothetical protein GCM10025771_02890 [Niveibacterium umoris]|uniref:HAMP domain-containing protein n=1 Tax=Niveibacterium umoris TaxID=1193620 RepID=A0A840BRV2_9RHOO|nr:cache domain-containing protein [Niveibacterium umoris]MBB4014169.1 HAMP domain-containing protein [Niveibacterium umoris]